jgi:hypothetical protein
MPALPFIWQGVISIITLPAIASISPLGRWRPSARYMLALHSHHLFVAIVIFLSVETSATVSSLGVSPYIIPKLTILGIIFRAVVAALLALLVATEVHKVTSIKGDNV